MSTCKYESLPLNARILVDYTKGGEVTFGYPEKITSRVKWAWRFIFPILLTMWAGWSLYLGIFFYAGFLVYVALSSTGGNVGAIAGGTWEGIIGTLIPVLLWVTPPLLGSFIIAFDYERYAKHFPEIGGKTKDYFAEITELDGVEYEIPLFENRVLEYKAEGEFSKYLEQVEIIEHPFKYRTLRGKEEVNDSLWKATFRFSEPPKKGKLRVEWR